MSNVAAFYSLLYLQLVIVALLSAINMAPIRVISGVMGA